MGLTAMLVGSVSGTGMHMMNNALQKVPLSRREFSTNVFLQHPMDLGMDVLHLFISFLSDEKGCGSKSAG